MKIFQLIIRAYVLAVVFLPLRNIIYILIALPLELSNEKKKSTEIDITNLLLLIDKACSIFNIETFLLNYIYWLKSFFKKPILFEIADVKDLICFVILIL